MLTLRIEHKVTDFAAWKKVFNADPLHRKASGVLGYRVQRPVNDELFVVIDLDFNERDTAETFVERLQVLWSSPAAAPALGGTPRTRILDTVEAADL